MEQEVREVDDRAVAASVVVIRGLGCCTEGPAPVSDDVDKTSPWLGFLPLDSTTLEVLLDVCKASDFEASPRGPEDLIPSSRGELRLDEFREI